MGEENGDFHRRAYAHDREVTREFWNFRPLGQGASLVTLTCLPHIKTALLALERSKEAPGLQEIHRGHQNCKVWGVAEWNILPVEMRRDTQKGQ